VGFKSRRKRAPLSSRNPNALGTPERLERISRAFAALDAIVSPSEFHYRLWSFEPIWSTRGERTARYLSGSGDDYFIVFDAAGAYLQGFDHEAPMSPYREQPPTPWPGLFDGLPTSMHCHRDEPAFGPRNCTFCLWWPHTSPGWHRGDVQYPAGSPDPDGSQWLLEPFDDPERHYIEQAEHVHEVKISPELVRAALSSQPLPLGELSISSTTCTELASLGFAIADGQ